MTNVAAIAELDCRLEVLPASYAVEFAAFGSRAPALASDWPRKPGAVRRGTDGWPTVLHFAPGRWLLPGPDTGLAVLVGAASAAGTGSAIDVTGKWTVMTLRGSDAARLLSATIDVGALLDLRECAAVELFDCPAVLTSSESGYRIYVRSSYCSAFSAAVERLGVALTSQLAT